jgi:hypothetical protein
MGIYCERGGKMSGCWSVLAAFFFFLQGVCFANSVNLFNDSIYTLTATLYDANSTVMGEFILNPRDATEWSDEEGDFGTSSQYAYQTPYSVNWTCMAGGAYGSCTNVASGSVVTAQSCGGVQECQQP